MGEDSEPASQATARDQAWAVAAAKWPRRRWNLADYDQVYDLLRQYFEVVFPRLDLPTCRAVVASTVDGFMASWHAEWSRRIRRGDGEFPGPQEVADAVRDAILERSGPGELIGPSVREDESLAARALRAKPDVVRAGLRELFAERAYDDFQVITQYLAMADVAVGRPPPTSAVVAQLGGTVGELAARQAIREFQSRLRGIGQADATA